MRSSRTLMEKWSSTKIGLKGAVRGRLTRRMMTVSAGELSSNVSMVRLQALRHQAQLQQPPGEA